MTLLWLGERPEIDRHLAGGKALSINSMLHMGLPVPPAFVLTTDTCAEVLANEGRLTARVVSDLRAGIRRLEVETGKSLGGLDGPPLLVAVRSGGARSMPGMMDTVLNLGMTPHVERSLADSTGDAHFAADTHRRFREQFCRVVGAESTGDPWRDLTEAAAAVFRSWDSDRAVSYRAHHGVPADGGTAVTVQAMVFGNLDDSSGTGVLFTRNPVTGTSEPFGEWLPRGQGEDVVSGRFDARPLVELRSVLPKIHAELMDSATTLERCGKDAQDIEFTVEGGVLYLLQTRAAKRSPEAAVRIAVALCEEGILTREEAVSLVSDAQLVSAIRPHIDPGARASARVLARGLSASPGVGTGVVVTSCDEAERLTDTGTDVVLVRPTTDPDDVSGMVVATAIVTEIGGSTSHAAVVSRELGTPCVVGCGEGSLLFLAGRTVTVDGTAGEVLDGHLPIVSADSKEGGAARILAGWAREAKDSALQH